MMSSKWLTSGTEMALTLRSEWCPHCTLKAHHPTHPTTALNNSTVTLLQFTVNKVGYHTTSPKTPFQGRERCCHNTLCVWVRLVQGQTTALPTVSLGPSLGWFWRVEYTTSALWCSLLNNHSVNEQLSWWLTGHHFSQFASNIHSLRVKSNCNWNWRNMYFSEKAWV